VVEEHVVDGEGNVVLRLELNGVTQLFRSDLGERDALDDRLASGYGDDRAGSADPRLLHAFLDRVRHDLRLADRSFRNDVPRKWNGGERLQSQTALALSELDNLNRARSNVEPECRGLPTESKQRHMWLPAFSSLWFAFYRAAKSAVSPLRCGRKLSIVVTVYNDAPFKLSTLLAPVVCVHLSRSQSRGSPSDSEHSRSSAASWRRLAGGLPIASRLHEPTLGKLAAARLPRFAVT